jgi:hypothetical protein
LASPDSIAKLRIVDALLTGAHEPDTGHHALLGAFLDETMLRQVDDELAANRYRTHEFGDSVLVERGVGSMVGRTEYTHRRIAEPRPRAAQPFTLLCESGADRSL